MYPILARPHAMGQPQAPLQQTSGTLVDFREGRLLIKSMDAAKKWAFRLENSWKAFLRIEAQ
jgi:hypothetical protein